MTTRARPTDPTLQDAALPIEVAVWRPVLVAPEPNIALFNRLAELIRTTPGSVEWRPLDRDARSAYPPLAHRDSTG